MDRGFRRRVAAFVIIAIVTAAMVWVYMHKNQHSRSRLTLIIPENAFWFYDFQTRQIEEGRIQGEIPYFDSLKALVPNMAILSQAKDRGEYGIDGHSDIILFENQDGWFACIAITSEPRMLEYLKNKIADSIAEKPVDQGNFYLSKSTKRNIYFAFKHKACMFYVPSDSTENGAKALDALNKIFSPKAKSVMGNKTVEQLYEQNNDVVFWSTKASGPRTHGVRFSNGTAVFSWPDLKPGAQEPSPLLFFKSAGLNLQETDVEKLLKPNNSITSNTYLNLTFRTIYQYLKPFTK